VEVKASEGECGEGLETQNWCAEIKIRAKRRAGELLKEMDRAQGRRTDRTSAQAEPKSPTFEQQVADAGLDLSSAKRYQTIASMPQEVFEEHIADTKAAGNGLTSSDTYVKAKQQHREQGH
jgi:hypothetical protein